MANEARKLKLLEEFRIIAEQKQQLAAVLPDLWKQCYDSPLAPQGPRLFPATSIPAAGAAAPVAALHKAAPKRAPTATAIPEAKRHKADDAFSKRVDDIFKTCSVILTKKLWASKNAGPFQQPVDIVKLKIPDYYNYVKVPMDLRTIKEKLARKDYKTPLEFRDDVRLVWRNCAAYNPPGHLVRQMGDSMSDIFEKAWKESHVEQLWQDLQFEMDPKGAPIIYRLSTLSGQLAPYLAAAPAEEQDRNREMGFMEKRKLSVRLGELQGDQMQCALDIVQQSMDLPDTDEEIELDLDALNNATLWRLKEYVDQVANKHKDKAATKNAPDKRPATNGVDKAHQAYKPTFQDANNTNGSASPGPEQEDHSESGQDSPQEVKGSTMDDYRAASTFHKDTRQLVDESATNPQEQSAFVKDRAARKADIPINAANWNTLISEPQPATTNEENDAAQDDVWKQFQTIAEQKKQREEEQKKLEEQQRLEQERRKEEAERVLREEEERKRKLAEEEERMQVEQQKAREMQLQAELAEIQAKSGTAKMGTTADMSLIANVAPAQSGLEAVGLVYKNDDEDINFEDD